MLILTTQHFSGNKRFSQSLDLLRVISGTQSDKLIKYKKKKETKCVNKSSENFHKGILTLKGHFVDSMVSIEILLLILNLQEQLGSEAELLGSNTKMRENTNFSLKFFCTSTELSLILHPHFHMKALPLQ